MPIKSIEIVGAPKVGGDLAKFQFPLAVDFCPGVGNVAIAGMLTGDDQVVGDDGGVVVQFDDVEIIGARAFGRSRLRGFDDITFVVEVAVGGDALEIVGDGAGGRGCV